MPLIHLLAGLKVEPPNFKKLGYIVPILKNLPEIEFQIVNRYFGLDKLDFRENGITLEEIGVHLNLSGQRVGQIKEKTLNYIKRTLLRNGWTEIVQNNPQS